MRYQFKPRGVCSKSLSFEIEEGLVRNLVFEGGCDGNLKGLAGLAAGRRPEEIIERLFGIRCGSKKTSCPDQLARALRKVFPEKVSG